MLNRVYDFLLRSEQSACSRLTAQPWLLSGRARAPSDGTPLELVMGGVALRLYPEFQLGKELAAPLDWILVDRDRYFSDVSGFARIACGDRVCVGRDNAAYQALFGFPKSVKRRQLEIQNDDGQISVRQLDREGETYLRCLEDVEEKQLPRRRLIGNLRQVRNLFGGPLKLLSSEAAVATLRQVNDIMQNESYRRKDAQGRPGGLLDLPDELSPIVVGDLHANIDNLLKILSEGAHVSALCRGDACLVLLGDAIHSENDGELEQMDSSLLILDLICKLKLQLPENVFYLRGNHESFDEDVGKGGVPQGPIFRRRARELRGEQYAEELQRFFEQQPYVVRSRDFVACHAGPPRSEVSMQDVVNIRSYPNLARELLWNRPKGRNQPAGYTSRQVKRFRESLGVDEDTSFIVGHTPLSRETTVWANVNGAPYHHIVYSAHKNNLAVFIRSGRTMVPLEYRAESLVDLTNALEMAEVVDQADVD